MQTSYAAKKASGLWKPCPLSRLTVLEDGVEKSCLSYGTGVRPLFHSIYLIMIFIHTFLWMSIRPGYLAPFSSIRPPLCGGLDEGQKGLMAGLEGCLSWKSEDVIIRY